ncbi:Clavaminate synthase-like protein [Tothia fuscella]|uniref:Clavaminate synthase-like protein n=1 Tax=Tothia fuscella TaxID=1048955 RepID=A0A9P4TVS9_9PEZI|nr:Clavaminate synthase-like protein [Tothia fuscella]
MATSTAHHGIQSLNLDNKSTSSLVFEPFELPDSNQRRLGPPHPSGTVTPLALRASTHNNEEIDLETVIQAIISLQTQDGIMSKALANHGTLLFRGLPINNAAEFSKFAHAFGYKPHEIIGIVVNRPLLAPNVAPANESAKEVLIYNHNESPQVPHAPEYIFFYCQKAPEKGGETPISSSLELFHRAKEEIPEFIYEIATKGILSRVVYKTEKQYEGGSSLKQAFGTEFKQGDDESTKKAKIEAQIARYGRGLAAHYKNSQNPANSVRKVVATQLYGDGTPIPEKYLAHLAKITDEIRVLHKWQKGDVLVQPWEGEQSDRVVLASLFDGPVPGAYTDNDWAKVVQAFDG